MITKIIAPQVYEKLKTDAPQTYERLKTEYINEDNEDENPILFEF